MSDLSFWECPNCGGTDFAEITQSRHQCVYCGTVLTTRETLPEQVECPRCGFGNEHGDRYCNNCGRALASWVTSVEGKKTGTDPATLSIIVSIVGSFFIPFGGAILGLVLGYRALRDARTSDGREKEERRAKTAIAVGWTMIALTTLPMCIAVIGPGIQSGCSLCQTLLDEMSNVVSGGG